MPEQVVLGRMKIKLRQGLKFGKRLGYYQSVCCHLYFLSPIQMNCLIDKREFQVVNK